MVVVEGEYPISCRKGAEIVREAECPGEYVYGEYPDPRIHIGSY